MFYLIEADALFMTVPHLVLYGIDLTLLQLTGFFEQPTAFRVVTVCVTLLPVARTVTFLQLLYGYCILNVSVLYTDVQFVGNTSVADDGYNYVSANVTECTCLFQW